MRGLSDQQKKFAKLIADGTNQGVAARLAGYSDNSADAQASRLLKSVKIQEYISFHKKSMEEIFAESAKDAAAVLQEIMSDKKAPPASRVRASTELLSRAGYVAPTKVEGTIHHSGSVESVERKEIHIIQELVNSNDDVADALLSALKARNTSPVVIPAIEEEKVRE